MDANWETADEQTLVDASLSGRSGAFDVIVERYRRQVYQLCYRFVGNHEDASDLAQDVFIRAYRGLRGFRARSSLGTWLYRIAVNVSLNRMAVKTPRTEALELRRAQRLGSGTARHGAAPGGTRGRSASRDRAAPEETACDADPARLS